jgi:hypothetical protein
LFWILIVHVWIISRQMLFKTSCHFYHYFLYDWNPSFRLSGFKRKIFFSANIFYIITSEHAHTQTSWHKSSVKKKRSRLWGVLGVWRHKLSGSQLMTIQIFRKCFSTVFLCSICIH